MTASSATESGYTTRPTIPIVLLLMRGLWGLLLLLAIYFLFQALPARFAQLQQSGDRLYQLDSTEIALLTDYSVSVSVYAAYNLLFELVQMGMFVVVGIGLFVRRSDEYGAVLVSLTLILNGIFAPATLYALAQTGQPSQLVLLETLRRILTVFFIYTFPDGRFVPSWTRFPAVIWSLAILLLPAVAGAPGNWSPIVQGVMVLLWLGPSLGAQVYRYQRVATREQRQQAKWFIYGIGLILIANLLRGVLTQLVPSFTQPGPLRLLYYTLVSVPILDTVMFIALPIAIGISIARFKLYGLTLVVNRSLVYGAVVGGLIFVFFIAFWMVQGAIQLVGGEPTLAVVVATALIVALFNPVRARTQHFIDRRFFHLRSDLDKIQAKERQRELQAAESPASHLVGSSLGAYHLLRLLGKGGMGEVYLAQHQTLQTPTAIKVLSGWLTNEQNFRLRFEQEAKIASTLNHPNIVRVYDLGAVDTTYYMVMEYIKGEDVGALLKRLEVLPLAAALPILRDVAAALDYAHAQGVIHRDVKPSNILIREGNGQAVLMDFGIAKLLDSQGGLTQSGLLGTLDYASPEQIMSAQTIDGRADIYGLGVTAYQLLTGNLPFKGSVGEVVFAHLQQPPPDPRKYAPELPLATANALLRALLKDPRDRFAT
ncbi:MAG: protein kinase, partial [Armatimonadetes bacterium]|nr:protein kinase [Anaerolineae bacterium]